MLTSITQAQLLCVQLGRLIERGTLKPGQISLDAITGLAAYR